MELEKIINSINIAFSIYAATKQTITNVEKVRIANKIRTLEKMINSKIRELVIPEHEPNKRYFISLKNDLTNYRVNTFMKHKFLLDETLNNFLSRKSQGAVFIKMENSFEEQNIDKEIEFITKITNFIHNNSKKCEKYFNERFEEESKQELRSVSYGGGYAFDGDGNRYWINNKGFVEF